MSTSVIMTDDMRHSKHKEKKKLNFMDSETFGIQESQVCNAPTVVKKADRMGGIRSVLDGD